MDITTYALCKKFIQKSISEVNESMIGDVQVNGESIVSEDGIANISIDTTIGKEITITEDIGGIAAGTTFPAETTVADVLQALLSAKSTDLDSNVYVGVSAEIPTSLDGLTQVAVNKEELLDKGYAYKNVNTDNQYVVLALPKSLNITCYQIAANNFGLGFDYTEDETYYFYYDSTKSTLTNARYQYSFEEV